VSSVSLKKPRRASQNLRTPVTGTPEEVYGQQVLDGLARESVVDYAPTSALDDAMALLTDSERRKLGEFQRLARDIAGAAADTKLAKVHEVLRGMLKDHYRPIVFCRFIDTANYLADELRRFSLSPRNDATTGIGSQ
jgi:ERCC4-related helicase